MPKGCPDGHFTKVYHVELNKPVLVKKEFGRGTVSDGQNCKIVISSNPHVKGNLIIELKDVINVKVSMYMMRIEDHKLYTNYNHINLD